MADEEAAKRRRAKRLHERITEIVDPQKAASSPEKRRSPPRAPTPREFIHEKMRELQEKTKQQDQAENPNDEVDQHPL